MFSSRVFSCLLFSAGSVLGAGLVKTHSCGSGPGVVIPGSLAKPFPALSCPPGGEAVQGPEPSVSGEGGGAGILTRCWWGWKLEHPFGKAVWQDVPEVRKLFGVGFLHNELGKVGKTPIWSMIGDGLVNCGPSPRRNCK